MKAMKWNQKDDKENVWRAACFQLVLDNSIRKLPCLLMSFILCLLKLRAKRLVDEFALLEFVDGVRAGGRAGRGVAARVEDVAAEQFPQARLDEGPRAHVRRFLLAPDDLFRLGVGADDAPAASFRAADKAARRG